MSQKEQEFDLEVKVQGHRPQSMDCDPSSLGNLPTCQLSKAHIKRQKSYSPDTICHRKNKNLNWRSVLGHRPQSMDCDPSSLGDLPTCKISKAYLKDKKVTAQT